MRTKAAVRGFTLVEMLVVLAIIALLAMILFPMFKSAREKARQSNCISRLHAIGQAVKQYHLDHKRYPRTLSDLQKYLDFQVQPDATTGTFEFVAGKEQFQCPDDFRTRVDPANGQPSLNVLASSYGGFARNASNAASTLPAADCSGTNAFDHPENCPMSAPGYIASDPRGTAAGPLTLQRHWNYWGYANPNMVNPGWGVALRRSTTTPVCGAGSGALLATDSLYFWHEYQTKVLGCPPANQVALPPGVTRWTDYPALANPNAPDNTIITHCWSHRGGTGVFNGLSWSEDTIEIVLRLGGEVKANKLMGTTPAKWVSSRD